MARPMSAAEYQQHRQDEIEGALRCHKFYDLHIDRLPQDIADPEQQPNEDFEILYSHEPKLIGY